MFNLQAYLDEQVVLNGMLEDQPEDWQLVSAIIAETGEIANAAKYNTINWAWWKRSDKPTGTREELLGELIDLFHFLLVGYNMQYGDIVPHYHQLLVDEQRKPSMPDIWAIPDFSYGIIQSVSMNRYFPAIQLWLDLTLMLGFGYDEIDEAFGRSIQKNLDRWNSSDGQ